MYGYYYGSSSPFSIAWVWPLALIAAILVMIFFLGKQNKGKYTGFLGFLYNFLNFRSFTLAAVLKFLYVFFALGIALTSLASLFAFGFYGFIVGLIGFVFGELFLRLVFESAMLLVVGVTNIVEINNHLGGNQEQLKFVEPDTEKAADTLSKSASTVNAKLKEKIEEQKELAAKKAAEKAEEKAKAEKEAEEKAKSEKLNEEKAEEINPESIEENKQ